MRTRLLTITLAIALAVFGMVAVLAYVHQANERAVNGLRAETVLVASTTIPAGTSLHAAYQNHFLTTEKVPDSSLSTPAVPVQAVTTHGRLVMSAEVAKGQVLLQNMLAQSATTAVGQSGSFVIPKGMVAVTMLMCLQEAVSDYLTPGSYVAVFDTYVNGGSSVQRTCNPNRQIYNSDAIARTQDAATRIVLTKAQVLAVGQGHSGQSVGANVAAAVDPAGSTAAAQGAVLVTLAVNQADAQRLILIEEVGLPYMALLGPTSQTSFGYPPNLFQP